MRKYEPIQTDQFKKDLKIAAKRKYNISLLADVVETLAAGSQLPQKNRDHALTGNWKGYRECHIQPDWLLVYRIDEGRLVLVLARTGTHSDLDF
ncbi:MAG: type II toxin-antitoxin system YafQ family toxin [Ruminococcus sp.]|nr:type II toxin-antitoxin system YafQ family toxin [Ruminococcus sp.]